MISSKLLGEMLRRAGLQRSAIAIAYNFCDASLRISYTKHQYVFAFTNIFLCFEIASLR